MRSIIVIFLSLAALARADTNLLTLAAAKRIAFANNWDLLAAQSDLDQATAQKIVAHEFPNPTLAYSTSKINVDGQPADTQTGNGLWSRNYDTIFALNQLFEIGGKRSARQTSSQAGFEAARARLLDAKRVLDSGITKTYIAAVLTETQAKVLNASAESLRQEAEIATIRLKAGDISHSDLDQIEIAAEQFALNAKAAAANAANQRVAVDVLLGVNMPSGQWIPGDDLDTLAGTSVKSSAPEIVPNRPDLVAAQAALRKAEYDLQLQRAMRIPDPTLLLQYEHEPPDQPNTVGIGISLPLPIWNKNRGAIRSAEVARDQAHRDIQRTRAQIVSDIAIADRAYREASQRLQKYRQALLPKSRGIHDTISLSYEKGQASLLDMLQAQRNDNDMRLAAAQAAADTANAATTLRAALNLSDTDTTPTQDTSKP